MKEDHVANPATERKPGRGAIAAPVAVRPRKPEPWPWRRAVRLAAAVVLSASCPADVFDGFEGSTVDPVTWKRVGLSGRDRVVEPAADHRTRAALVWVEPADEEMPAARFAAEEPRADCPSEPPHVVQRSELRLRNESAFGQGRWYGFSFRMDGGFEPTGSTRWVIGQWKQSQSCWSPFLAQRFDNGVFHLTVEDNDCRVMIAKAAGDPDAEGAPVASGASPARRRFFATNVAGHLMGSFVEWSPRAGQDCMAAVKLDPPDPPELPSPYQRWVHMAYLVRGGLNGTGRVEVYADGRHVVTATGSIGDARAGNMEYFKFGLYRDQIKLRSTMLFDSFRRGPTRESVDPYVCGE